MKIEHLAIPDFEHPPVLEVVFSVRFEEVPALNGPYLGLAWTLFRGEYPYAEQHPPVDPVAEVLDNESPPPGIQIQLVTGLPTPRYWFLNEDRTGLIQLQPDRFTINWRKVTGAETYPRFEQVLRVFAENFHRFCAWIHEEKLGQVAPMQCELSYVNHIESGTAGQSHNEAERVFSSLCRSPSATFLPDAELVELATRYVITDDDDSPVGRLHVGVKPIVRATDRKAAYRMELTARGAPEGEGLDGVMRFFRRGHVWIVRGFADLTTSQMHSVWRRRDDKPPRDC
jgi:uncharacterized protein (TIGR04255 family)